MAEPELRTVAGVFRDDHEEVGRLLAALDFSSFPAAAAGAEALSITEGRVTPGTAVLDTGNAILANSAYLAPPYDINAIGPDDLYERLTSAASFVEFVQDRIQPYALRLSFAELDSVTIPAYAGTIRSRYARHDA